MSTSDTDIKNTNITIIKPVISPIKLHKRFPTTPEQRLFIQQSREEINSIISGKCLKKLIVVGPCSIHDVKAAEDYAKRLASLRRRYHSKLSIVMRVYFEKPRTTVGWKGLINDPQLDGTGDMAEGLVLARSLMLKIIDLGLPIACEFLDTFTPQYLADLVSWGSIGARTVESQIHRQMASGLSMAIGFKNTTAGHIKPAVDAVTASQHEHNFYGIDDDGQGCIITSKGNSNTHIILRGGSDKPNYYNDIVETIPVIYPGTKVVIDCSHGNSGKDYKRQKMVWLYFIENYLTTRNIIGMMLESNIYEGNQKVTLPKSQDSLEYGVSITDACVGFKETEDLLNKLYTALLRL